MQEQENWEFIRWISETSMMVLVNGSAWVIQSNMTPFFDIVAAAHGPYHEPTEQELARLAELERERNARRNKGHLKESLQFVSHSVDNPSHWNRLSPDTKSAMLTYYRDILTLREHETFEGSGRIEEHLPTAPEYDSLANTFDSTPHRETPFLVSGSMSLKPGELLVRQPTKVDKHTRNHIGEKATVANTLLANNFDLYLATHGFKEAEEKAKFAVASDRGLMRNFMIEDAVGVGDRLCFRPMPDGRIILAADHPHGWPDCGFFIHDITGVTEDDDHDFISFWWDAREAERMLRNLADPQDVCLLPDLQVEDGCMTILTAGTDRTLPEPENNARFWLRNRSLGEITYVTDKTQPNRATIVGDGDTIGINETVYVTWDSAERVFSMVKVNDGTLGQSRFKLIADRSDSGNYQLPTSNTFNLVSWVADWDGGKLVDVTYNGVEIARFAAVLSGFSFRRIDISSDKWREIGDTLINNRGTVHTRIIADGKVVHTSAFQIGY